MENSRKRAASEVMDGYNGNITKPKLHLFKAEFAPDLFLSVSFLKGVQYIHIRQFYRNSKGHMQPSYNGAVFTEKRFAALLTILPELETRYNQFLDTLPIDSFDFHVGGGWKVTIDANSSQIDFRKFFPARDGTIRPSKKGIVIDLDTFRNLSDRIYQLLSVEPRLRVMIPCFKEHSPETACYECLPFNQSWNAATQFDTSSATPQAAELNSEGEQTTYAIPSFYTPSVTPLRFQHASASS